MASNFKYQAVDTNGQIVKGTILAEDKSDAIVKLKNKYDQVKSITNMGEQGTGLSMEIGSKKIKNEELALLCSQYSIILKSGAQIDECTKLLANQAENKKLKKILMGVSDDITSGRTLASAFERNGKKDIPITFYETVRAGEESGNLDYAFETLETYFNNSASTMKKVKGALIYPTFVLIVAVVVLIVIMAYVVPKLTDIFNDFGGDLPFITKLLVSMSTFFKKYVWIMLAVIVLIIVIYRLYYATKDGGLKIDAAKLKMPILGKIQTASLSAQFANTLAMLMKSGVTMTKALQVLARTFSNKYVKKTTEELAEAVENGRSLSSSMRRYDCFPGTLTEMVGIGESTGELEPTMMTMGTYYNNEADNLTKSFLAKIEPTLLIVTAIFAGFIVISIYLPLFQMYDLF